MLTLEEAWEHIIAALVPRTPRATPLAECLGMILAEDILSPADSPPFDKSLMDGYAVRSSDMAAGPTSLRVVESVMAGQVPTVEVGAGQAIRVMTGAPLPFGADAVVPVEWTNRVDTDATVEIASHPPLSPGDNILRQGASMRRGERILTAGQPLRSQQIGTLAEIGQICVSIRKAPRIAILATGDELVPLDQTPGPGQIRNSNESMLTAQVTDAKGIAVPLGIAADNRTVITERIRTGLDCDILLLSGGVSAGEKDLVPAALAAAGVREVFHKVQLKPGKPVWFGVCDLPTESASQADEVRRVAVFGLPGNPVSSMVCFELLVRTAMRCLTGEQDPIPRPVRCRLEQKQTHRGGRPTFHPAKLIWKSDGPWIRPLPWQGSADLRATVDANALLHFPAGDADYPTGEIMDVYRL